MRSVRKVTFLGLMLAMIIALTALEYLIPPLPLLPPGVKPGLSNIVTMYCLFFVNPWAAVTLNFLKAIFVLSTRGFTAGLLSLCGGMLSIGVIILLNYVFKNKISYAAISVAGACGHNIGQYAMAAVLLSTPALVVYLPVLLISGVVMGVITGTILKLVLPALNKINRGL
ncbi:MAG: Gx transporter family protein [Oscillospiraceae bacterium]|nr:Gx transporter family protein [Oscillospiraceae bacterium]